MSTDPSTGKDDARLSRRHMFGLAVIVAITAALVVSSGVQVWNACRKKRPSPETVRLLATMEILDRAQASAEMPVEEGQPLERAVAQMELAAALEALNPRELPDRLSPSILEKGALSCFDMAAGLASRDPETGRFVHDERAIDAAQSYRNLLRIKYPRWAARNPATHETAPLVSENAQ